MMKKICGYIIIASMVMVMACGNEEVSDNISAEESAPVEEMSQVEEGLPNEEVTTAGDSSGGDKSSAKGDVDLTKMSSTMIYAEVYNIMMEPEEYVGRRIKMRGQFQVDYGRTKEENRYSVIIADATACCAQGLMFVLAGEHVYPDDYPEVGSEITVEGEFQLYDKEEYFYYHLAEAEIL